MGRATRIFLAFLAGLCSGCSMPATTADVAIEENRVLDQRFAEAYKTKDLDGLMGHIWNSDDVIRYPSDDIEGQMGWDEIRRSVKFQLDAIEQVVNLEIIDPHYYFFEGTVVGSSKMILTVLPKGSPKVTELVIRSTSIRQRKEEKWVYIYFHESMTPMLSTDLVAARLQ